MINTAKHRQSVGLTLIEVPFVEWLIFGSQDYRLQLVSNLSQIDLTKKEPSQFITGEIFGGEDSWRIQVIMLVAIAVEENLEIVQYPHCMMDIANGLAAAGVPHIVEMLREGNHNPIWNLSDALDELLRSDSYGKDDKDLSNVLSEALR